VRSKLGLSALTLVAALVVTALVAPAASAHGKGKGKHRTTLVRVMAERIQAETIDVGVPGPSLGDELVFSQLLFIRNREVGTSGAVCTITEGTPPYDVATYHCVGTLSLRKGQVTLQGLVEVQGEDDPGPFTLAITGGTGAYAGAGGVATFRDFGDLDGVYKLRFTEQKGHHRH
jgi:hypothetical protein